MIIPMAGNIPMGPPLSPREPRRSGRRSVPNAASSAESKSSNSHSPGPEPISAGGMSNKSSGGGRRKSIKDEADDSMGIIMQPVPAVQKKGKRKSKKELVQEVFVEEPLPNNTNADANDEEDENGITRCVCGRNVANTADEDDEVLSFWIQCETCKVWQHGHCVGYEQEKDAPDHYHCEVCHPELHVELLKKLNKKPKAASAPLVSRSSRSHSPGHALVQASVALNSLAPAHPVATSSKRRNTMNSRETAYHDDLMKKVTEDSLHSYLEGTSIASSIHPDEDQDMDVDNIPRKKRKRSETTPLHDMLHVNTRSESSTSDRPIASTLAEQHPPSKILGTGAQDEVEDDVVPTPAPAIPRGRGGRRGGRKDPDAKKQPNQYTHYNRRPSHRAGQASISTHPQGSNANGIDTNHTNVHEREREGRRLPAPPPLQPLLTTWGLPDYLNHLLPMLPTLLPMPLHVPMTSAYQTTAIGATPLSDTYIEERGVKVKWPLKRMSIADMGKRVRGLMEWVAREQVGENERKSRRSALASAILLAVGRKEAEHPGSLGLGANLNMEIDSDPSQRPIETTQGTASTIPADISGIKGESSQISGSTLDTSAVLPNMAIEKEKEKEKEIISAKDKSTTQLMEELMLDLIAFQERFGAQSSGKGGLGRELMGY